MENNIQKSFIKKYWVVIIIFSITLILSAISIDVWYSYGSIQAEQINIFEKGSKTPTIVQTHKFVYEHPILKLFSLFLYSFAMSLLISLFILKVIQKDDDRERELKDEKRKDLATEKETGVTSSMLRTVGNFLLRGRGGTPKRSSTSRLQRCL